MPSACATWPSLVVPAGGAACGALIEGSIASGTALAAAAAIWPSAAACAVVAMPVELASLGRVALAAPAWSTAADGVLASAAEEEGAEPASSPPPAAVDDSEGALIAEEGTRESARDTPTAGAAAVVGRYARLTETIQLHVASPGSGLRRWRCD